MTNNKKTSVFDEKGIEELPLNKVFERERKAKKMSLKALSEKTGISLRNLQKIEKGKWEDLPAEIYLRSFFEKIEKAMNLKNGYLLDLYEKEVAFLKRQNNNKPIKRISKDFFVVTPKLVARFIFFVFFVFIIVYFFYQLNFLVAEPKLIVTNPENDIITELKEITVLGQTYPDNKVMINGNEVPVDENGNFSASLLLQEGINTIKITSENRIGKQKVIIKRVILK